jgi:hypothetical protein
VSASRRKATVALVGGRRRQPSSEQGRGGAEHRRKDAATSLIEEKSRRRLHLRRFERHQTRWDGVRMEEADGSAASDCQQRHEPSLSQPPLRVMTTTRAQRPNRPCDSSPRLHVTETRGNIQQRGNHDLQNIIIPSHLSGPRKRRAKLPGTLPPTLGG